MCLEEAFGRLYQRPGGKAEVLPDAWHCLVPGNLFSGVIFKCHDAMPLCTMHQILAHLEMPRIETRFQRIFRQINIVAMENGWVVGDFPSYKPPFINYRFIDVDRCRSIQMDANR
jgi:hypothetical protein